MTRPPDGAVCCSRPPGSGEAGVHLSRPGPALRGSMLGKELWCCHQTAECDKERPAVRPSAGCLLMLKGSLLLQTLPAPRAVSSTELSLHGAEETKSFIYYCTTYSVIFHVMEKTPLFPIPLN